jgi:hypothetical protein
MAESIRSGQCVLPCLCAVALLLVLHRGVASGQWLDLVNQHRDHIRTALESGPEITGRSAALALLANPIEPSLNIEARRNLFAKISFLGRRNGWMEDPVVISIVAGALTDADHEIGGRAISILLSETPRHLLILHNAAIKAATQTISWRKQERLLALLPLDEQERAELLAKPGLDREVRARLGDTAAEDELIEAFHAEREWGPKAGLAYALGYVGSQRAGEALVRDLKSDVVRRQKGTVSIRVPIIQALKMMHDQEPLFWEDEFATKRGDDFRDDPRAEARAFLDRVYQWAEVTYGIMPEGPEGEPLFAAYEGIAD